MPGMLCMPNTASHGKRSNRPSSIMARAPALPPSSAGWKMKCTVPSKSRCAARYCAAPSSMAVWPSWPQPCMRPSMVERCAKRLCSGIGKASMSARSPMRLPPEPARSTPTTPVLPSPVCTSSPHSRNFSATRADVRVSLNANSGWAWISRRNAVRSACARSMASMVFMARIRTVGRFRFF
ncbi:Uncharacterised protein [Bordetella pertussis]|nr:Uncharacterised protein [Bordetella pertussis]